MVLTKKEAVEGFAFLQRSAIQKHYVGAYHASLTEETSFVRQFFIKNHWNAMPLCNWHLRWWAVYFFVTWKFSQGMDMLDIRSVIVYFVPRSISQFYQVKVHTPFFFWWYISLLCSPDEWLGWPRWVYFWIVNTRRAARMWLLRPTVPLVIKKITRKTMVSVGGNFCYITWVMISMLRSCYLLWSVYTGRSIRGTSFNFAKGEKEAKAEAPVGV